MIRRGTHPNSLRALQLGNRRAVKCLCGKCVTCYNRVYQYDYRRGKLRRKTK